MADDKNPAADLVVRRGKSALDLVNETIANDPMLRAHAELLARVQTGEVDAADAVMDGAALAEELLGDEPKATLVQVLKLTPTKTIRAPAIRGVFLGYQGVKLRTPKTTDGEADRWQVLDYVLLQPRAGLILKVLGTYQIMQGMALASVGDLVTIIRLDAPAIELAGGRQVKPYSVLVDQRGKAPIMGSAQPRGVYAEAAMGAAQGLTAGPAAPALTAGAPPGETVDAGTGEVRTTPAA